MQWDAIASVGRPQPQPLFPVGEGGANSVQPLGLWVPPVEKGIHNGWGSGPGRKLPLPATCRYPLTPEWRQWRNPPRIPNPVGQGR